jgi:hypothetical protein
MTVLHAGADAVVITDDMDEGITCSNIVNRKRDLLLRQGGHGLYQHLDRDGIGITTGRSVCRQPGVGRVPSVRFRPLGLRPPTVC